MSQNFKGIQDLFTRKVKKKPSVHDDGLRSLETSESKITESKITESEVSRLRTQKTVMSIHHYRREGVEEKSRIHLRLDPDGHGTLIINANRILHLNPTAALMAYCVLEETSEKEAVRLIRKKYSVGKAQARADLAALRSQLEELVRPDGACPIHELGLETIMPFSARPTAPYRLDLALTYRCNNDCAHCYNVQHPSRLPSEEKSGMSAELSTSSWKRIIDRAWELGIPHIIFTGGEPTLRADLPELIAHAEHNGQITGLNTNARRLSDAHYVETLVEAGLDHVQITLEFERG